MNRQLSPNAMVFVPSPSRVANPQIIPAGPVVLPLGMTNRRSPRKLWFELTLPTVQELTENNGEAASKGDLVPPRHQNPFRRCSFFRTSGLDDPFTQPPISSANPQRAESSHHMAMPTFITNQSIQDAWDDMPTEIIPERVASFEEYQAYIVGELSAQSAYELRSLPPPAYTFNYNPHQLLFGNSFGTAYIPLSTASSLPARFERHVPIYDLPAMESVFAEGTRESEPRLRNLRSSQDARVSSSDFSGPGISPWTQSSTSGSRTQGRMSRSTDSSANHGPKARERADEIRAGSDASNMLNFTPSSPPTPINQGSNGSGIANSLQLSDDLARQWESARPTIDESHTHMPFAGGSSGFRSNSYGLIKLVNAPWEATKQDIVNMFHTRSIRLAAYPEGTGNFAIHYMMNRTVGNLGDVFVELQSYPEALDVVGRYANRQPRIKLGRSNINLEACAQEILMKQIFPRAVGLVWRGTQPIRSPNTKPFHPITIRIVTDEELHNLTRLAEKVKSTRQLCDHPQRVWEDMTSILRKYPWSYTDFYTLADRNAIYNATSSLIGTLAYHIRNKTSPNKLNTALMKELLETALLVPAFSETQRANLRLLKLN